MKQHVGPHLVGSQPGMQQVCLASGRTTIPPATVSDYKKTLVASYPGTRFGDWLYHKMVPMGLVRLVGALLAVTCFVAGIMLIRFSMTQDTDLLKVAWGFSGLVVGFVWVPIGLFVVTPQNLLPSYWVRVKWPTRDEQNSGAILVPPEAESMRERIMALASPNTRFEIDVFYKNGVREDPIGYAIDPIDGSEHAFVVWIDDVLVEL